MAVGSGAGGEEKDGWLKADVAARNS